MRSTLFPYTTLFRSEIGGGEHKHLARTVVAEVVVPLLVPRRLRPAEKVSLLPFGLLREEVVRETNRQLAILVQRLHHRIVLWIVLEAAAGIDRAGHPQSIQFAQEMARGVELILERKLGTLRKGGVEDPRVRLREQQSGRIGLPVANDLTS